MKKQKSVATITATISQEKKSFSLEYDSLESLAKAVFNLTLPVGYVFDQTIVTLPDGTSYRWCETYAHYCFSKNRISETEFVNLQFTEDFKL